MPKTNKSCPYKCIYSVDRQKYEAIADVRVFHGRSFDSKKLPSNNPKALNVYFTLEPPYLTFSYKDEDKAPPDYFNVTASYRSSSEIYFPYDYFIKQDGSELEDDVWTEEQVFI